MEIATLLMLGYIAAIVSLCYIKPRKPYKCNTVRRDNNGVVMYTEEQDWE